MGTATFEDVAAAAKQLQGARQPVSIRSVRRVLGGGSPNVIHRHLREWRTAQLVPGTAQTPVSMVAQMTEAAPRFWAAALEEARGRVKAEMDQLQIALDQERTHVDDLQGLLDDSEERRLQAVAEQQRAVSALDAITAQDEVLREQHAHQVQRGNEAQAHLEAQHSLILTLTKHLEEKEAQFDQARLRHREELATRDDVLQAMGKESDQLQAALDSSRESLQRQDIELDESKGRVIDRDRRLVALEDLRAAERSAWSGRELQLCTELAAARAAAAATEGLVGSLREFIVAQGLKTESLILAAEKISAELPLAIKQGIDRLSSLEANVINAIHKSSDDTDTKNTQ